MAEYRTIKPTIWSDPWFEDITDSQKLLYIYLFTNEHINNAGIMKVSTGKIAFETNMTRKDVEACLSYFKTCKKIELHGELIWVVQFIKHQTSTSPKMLKNIAKEIEQIPYKNLIDRVLNKYDTLSIPYRYPIDTKEREREEERELEREEERELEDNNSTSNEVLVETPEKPPEVSPPETAKRIARCPQQEILKLFHIHCPSLPTVNVKLGKTSAANLRQRWKENHDLEWWSDYWESVEASDFLTGRVDPKPGRDLFVATFHWLIRPSNMEKVQNGYYQNRGVKTVWDQEGL